MFKSLEQGKLDDEDPCAEKENERKLRGNKNSTEQRQNTETNSQRKARVTKAPVMTTFYPISNDDIDDEEDGDDDGNNDEDFQASGNEIPKDPSHDMKDINYSSTESFAAVSSYDEGYVTSANRDGIDDDDDDNKDVNFINDVDGEDNDAENDDDDDKYIKTEDEHVNTTLRSGIDSNTTDAAAETIDGADDDPINTYGVMTNDLDSTSTREDDDNDDGGEGIYFTSESLIDRSILRCILKINFTFKFYTRLHLIT